jgi:hypothetical protein
MADSRNWEVTAAKPGHALCLCHFQCLCRFPQQGITCISNAVCINTGRSLLTLVFYGLIIFILRKLPLLGTSKGLNSFPT